MTTDQINALTALLVEAEEAHGVYETNELDGVYDAAWAEWYAGYAVDHGIAAILGRPVTREQLGPFLASTFTAFQQAQPQAEETWAGWTARRIVTEL